MAGYYEIAWSNAQANLFSRKEKTNPTYPMVGLVSILGGGKISLRELELLWKAKIPTIACNRSIRRGGADYFVGVDPRVEMIGYLEGLDLSRTRAYLYSGAHPKLGFLGWKDVGWFSSPFLGYVEGIPCHLEIEGVVGHALQFARYILGARKVIMLGMQHPKGYERIRVGLETMCQAMSEVGMKIWNCTKRTTLRKGVLLGSIEEALVG